MDKYKEIWMWLKRLLVTALAVEKRLKPPPRQGHFGQAQEICWLEGV